MSGRAAAERARPSPNYLAPLQAHFATLAIVDTACIVQAGPFVKKKNRIRNNRNVERKHGIQSVKKGRNNTAENAPKDEENRLVTTACSGVACGAPLERVRQSN